MPCQELQSLNRLADFYRDTLVNDVARFWLAHSLDRQCGGYLTILDRDGTPHGTSKYIWPQARGAFMFAKLYSELQPQPQWLDAARLGIEFLDAHALRDGRAFFKCTRQGAPISARPGEIYAEAFIVMAYAHYARAAAQPAYFAKARDLLASILARLDSGDLATSPYREHAPGMIMINCCQEFRAVADGPDPQLDERIASWVHDELFTFASTEHQALFERVGFDGRPVLTEPEGRAITPGHGMESAWFCLEEGLYRRDRRIIDRAVEVIRWTLQRGWDREYGGIFNFVDLLGKPPGHHDEDWGEGQDWDAKLFWPHAESLYALLLAYLVTRQPDLWDHYVRLHQWTFSHFPDPQFGEWFGFLRRDGSVSQNLKGAIKGFFHVPRALFKCLKALESAESLRRTR